MAPVTRQAAKTIAAVTQTVTRNIAPASQPVSKSVAPAAQSVAQSVAPAVRPVLPAVGPMTQTVTSLAPIVAIDRPTSGVTSSGSSPASGHVNQTVAPRSFGTGASGLVAAQLVTPALSLASSVALTGGFVSITAPRTACPSCGLAGRPSPSAPVQAPAAPVLTFHGWGGVGR